MNQKPCPHDTLNRITGTDEQHQVIEYWECEECGEVLHLSTEGRAALIKLQKEIAAEIVRIRKELND